MGKVSKPLQHLVSVLFPSLQKHILPRPPLYPPSLNRIKKRGKGRQGENSPALHWIMQKVNFRTEKRCVGPISMPCSIRLRKTNARVGCSIVMHVGRKFDPSIPPSHFPLFSSTDMNPKKTYSQQLSPTSI